MPELPWTKWFPSNWASDPQLSMCDVATQGVWMNAINAMMLINSPRISGTIDQLSRVCRCRRAQLEAAICEIRDNGVGTVIEQNGCIILECRRMVREHNTKDLRRKAANSRWCKGDAQGMHTPMQPDHANVMHTPMHDNHANTHAPSASASAYASASNGIGDAGKGIEEFLRQLGEAFKRPTSQPWTYAEQTAALEICRSPTALEELALILRWRSQVKPEDRRYLPQSVSRLLASWGDVLDRARAGVVVGDSTPPKPTMLDKEWKEIMREAERLQ